MGRFQEKSAKSSSAMANEESSIVNEDAIVDVDGCSSSESSDDYDSEDADVDVEQVEDDDSEDSDTDSSCKPKGEKKGHHNQLERVRRKDLACNHGDLNGVVKQIFPTSKVSGRDKTLSLTCAAIRKVDQMSKAIKKKGADYLQSLKCLRAVVPPEKLDALNRDICRIQDLFGVQKTSPEKK